MKTNKITFHRDRTITFWNVYQQQWERTAKPSDQDLASIPSEKRARVIEHTREMAEEFDE